MECDFPPEACGACGASKRILDALLAFAGKISEDATSVFEVWKAKSNALIRTYTPL